MVEPLGVGGDMTDKGMVLEAAGTDILGSTRDLYLIVATTMSQEARNDEWNSDRPKDEGKYDGPAGMEPDGVIDSNWDEVCENFDDMDLREELLRGIYAYGF